MVLLHLDVTTKTSRSLKAANSSGKLDLQMCRRLAVEDLPLAEKGHVQKLCLRFPKLEEVISVEVRNDRYYSSNADKKILGFKDVIPLYPDMRTRFDALALRLKNENPCLKSVLYQEPLRGWSYRTMEQKAFERERKEREARCDEIMLAAYK
jgi:hypothetical protein